MVAQQVGIPGRDKGRHPDGRLKSRFLDLAAERVDPIREVWVRRQPIPHVGLIAVIELDEFQFWERFFDRGEIVKDILLGDRAAVTAP